MKATLFIIGLCILLFISVTNTVDDTGHEYFDKAIKNAATTYLIARGINGAISLIQDAEVMASPAGVGVSVSPGEILDPLNDLIEQFSTIMLLATASLGIQKFLLVFSGWWFTKATAAVLLVIAAIGAAIGSIPKCRRIFSRVCNPLFIKVMIAVLSIRLMVPFIVISNGVFESIFLHERINDRIQSIQVIEEFTTDTAIDREGVERNWIGGITGMARELGQIQEKAKILKDKLSNSVDNLIDLAALFMIQTVLFPLAFFYLALKMAGLLWRRDFSRYTLEYIHGRQDVGGEAQKIGRL
ncbi:MAG: hypothetical protein ACOWWM_13400 [Desulfobacterales bacterium]